MVAGLVPGETDVTHFLRSVQNPDGHRLEDLLIQLRADVISRCDLISSDHRPEALQVLANNVKILGLLSQGIDLAFDSTRVLDRAFGPSETSHGGPPRIGKADAA
jgi:hypothetical protein